MKDTALVDGFVAPQSPSQPFYKILYVQVLIAIAIGVALGVLYPHWGEAMKPLGDGFIKLIKMIIPVVIFCTVVSGISGMHDAKKVGRVGGKAILYFEVVSTFALLIGLIVANVFKPGAGFNADPATLDSGAISSYTRAAEHQSMVDFLLHMIPDTLISAFVGGDVLQVLVIAVLFGLSLSAMGPRGEGVRAGIDSVAQVIFKLLGLIMKAAPIGAFGAMAFTIGRYGISALLPLLKLVAAFYLTAALFVVIVLGLIARWVGVNIFRYIAYIKEELLIVLGTSSSESVLPSLMQKLERMGCSKPVVGLVVPAGYSFNLDGTNIYMTMAALFVAQATNTDLTLTQELTLLGVAMITSKGAAGVTGSGFVTLAATIAVVPTIPIEGMALILGIDRFMSECRALTNFIGNGVATIFVARWENELDHQKMAVALSKSDGAATH
ncbi:dicarboxylate/amino acid:cation symporter [Steroidobacter cummioxidans]|uniref:dicarboxylate/amino acid:cation symporter n=1 Tax=Steroidobacter cummioxidans TaxID=1803913 RepID=UPI0023B19EFD|nr:dicarboxylate/amino acid:cation symporter [Steroidobacter cummioxidans]